MPSAFECRLSRFGRRLKKFALRGRSKQTPKTGSQISLSPSSALIATPDASQHASPTSSLTPSLELDNPPSPPSPSPSPSPSPLPSPPLSSSSSSARDCHRCRTTSDNSTFAEAAECARCPLFDIIGFSPASNSSVSENATLPIVLLALVVTCRQPRRLRFTARCSCPDDSVLARAGFYRPEKESNAVCAFCGEEAIADRPSFAALMSLHSGTCAYRDLWVMLQLRGPKGDSDKVRVDFLPLVRHIQAELQSTKATVAQEFRFSADQIAMEVAHRFLTAVTAFTDAGALIDALSQRWDFTDEAEQWLALDGMADFIANLDTAPRPPGQVQRLRKSPSALPQARPPKRVFSGRERLLRETQLLLKMSRCRMCEEEEANQLCLPCSHVSLCGTCAPRASVCPRCKTPVETVVRTYNV